MRYHIVPVGLTRDDKIQIGTLLIGTLLVVLNYTLLAPALPVIMHEFSLTETTVQWLTSIYALVEAVVIPLNAFLLGRFSTRRLFTLGLALFTVGSLVVALGPTFEILLVGRVLQAIAGGIAMPMVFTLTLLTVPRESRGQMMGLVGVVLGFAPAIGPPASGALIDVVGWRTLFVIVAALGAVSTVIAYALLKNHEGFERTSFDVVSVVLSSLGMGSLLYGLSTITSSDTPLVSAAFMVVGVVLLVAFVRRQSTLDVPMLRVATLKEPRFRTAVIVCCLMEAALIAIDVLLPLLMQNALGATPTMTGLAMAPAALAGAVAGVVAGRIFDKKGVRGIALAGSAALVASGVGMCFVGLDTSLVLVAALYFVETTGWQFVSTPSNTWGINSLPNDIIQHGNAVLSTLMQVGASFGTAALVSLTAWGPLFAPGAEGAALALAGYRVAFIGCVVMFVAVAIVVLAREHD